MSPISVNVDRIGYQDGFIAEKAEEEGWENMDEDQRKTRETMAKALYHVFEVASKDAGV
jgi:hypothetical protein